MSIVKEIYPQCDICQTTYPDTLSSTVRECRRGMRGWKRRGYQDVCPDCVNETTTKEK